MPEDKHTYSELDKRYWTYTPNLVRWRQRHRGPKESLKINQETSQTLYDLHRLNKAIDGILETLDSIMEDRKSGRTFDSVDYYNIDVDDSAGTYETAGLNSVSDQISTIKNRLKKLEGKQ